MSVITLTTDFGLVDGFVGIMKGVICSINPHAVCIDISHELEPGDIRSAAWILSNAYRYFPDDTVHLVVVDPGVGSERRGLVLTAECAVPGLNAVGATNTRPRKHTFVCPDNGILSQVLDHEQSSFSTVVEIKNLDLCLTPISNTFHGRDVFAPIAAHLSAGLKSSAVGPAIDIESIVKFRTHHCETVGSQVLGVVVHVDRFGNLITNIPAGNDLSTTALSCLINEFEMPIGRTYSSAKPGFAVAYAGSHGYLEIGLNSKRADHHFSAGIGTNVTINLDQGR